MEEASSPTVAPPRTPGGSLRQRAGSLMRSLTGKRLSSADQLHNDSTEMPNPRTSLARAFSNRLSMGATANVTLTVDVGDHNDDSFGLDPSSTEAQHTPATPSRLKMMMRAVSLATRTPRRSLASEPSSARRTTARWSSHQSEGEPCRDEMDVLASGCADHELGLVLHGASALLAAAGIKASDSTLADRIDRQLGGVLSLARAFDTSGRPAVISLLMELGMGRTPAQRVANALQRARREGAPLVRQGELPHSADVVPLPEGWHARVYVLSDIHVDHEANRAWLRAAVARLVRTPCTVDVLCCCGDLCEELDDLREVLAELRARFDHVLFTPGNHDLWIRRGKHADSVQKLKAVLAMCSDIRVRCSPLWLRAARAPQDASAAGAPEGAGAASGPAPGVPRLPAARVLELQEECLADDVEVDLQLACTWSEAQVIAFFESGGVDVPAAGGTSGGDGSGGGRGSSAGSMVDTSLSAPEDVLLVPLFSWYDYLWDVEPDIEGQQPDVDLKAASDFQFCRWPAPLEDYNAYEGRAPTGQVSRWFGALNQPALARIARDAPLDASTSVQRPPPTRRLSGRSTFALYHGKDAPPPRERFLCEVDLDSFCTRRTDAAKRTWEQSFEQDVGVGEAAAAATRAASAAPGPSLRRRPGGPFVISCSHFLPRQELLPEKRLLKFPSLAKIAGSQTLAEQVAQLGPDIHVFGHTHLPWDATVGGVRYVQWPLGNPKEHADPSSVKGTGLVGSFMKVYDGSDGGEAPEHFTTFCAHYAEFERDLRKTALAPHVLK